MLVVIRLLGVSEKMSEGFFITALGAQVQFLVESEFQRRGIAAHFVEGVFVEDRSTVMGLFGDKNGCDI